MKYSNSELSAINSKFGLKQKSFGRREERRRWSNHSGFLKWATQKKRLAALKWIKAQPRAEHTPASSGFFHFPSKKQPNLSRIPQIPIFTSVQWFRDKETANPHNVENNCGQEHKREKAKISIRIQREKDQQEKEEGSWKRERSAASRKITTIKKQLTLKKSTNVQHKKHQSIVVLLFGLWLYLLRISYKNFNGYLVSVVFVSA